ncbi:unnamed protein product [Rotaria magnacalcarata]|uniref:Metalloendopeptidase n=2 Tax=Rotaria magnacalcarata TaxID=392030 RepID=A0A819FK62_9BILA|nr:unnamed protein product [Rotaria magnacalcarata]CAF1585139.1 unnamed protein product [Rotaria magnacalcarata]CAF2018798.1 unnamed protein product [Rotaria magnacalcarata]CAF2066266.1 unnamed protein product [Rotaria magnacalcarata]CAF2085757.1 unnamed protein product [Rotaria magnacalcarata]
MLRYAKLYLCLIFLSCKAYAIPLKDSGDTINLFGLEGLSENNATGATFIEGDIAVPLKNGRTAYIRSPKWPNGVVPIDFDSSYSTAQKNIIIGAMTEIMTNTNNCIRFVWRTTNTPVWLRIHPGQGCWSYMGKTKSSGAQDLSLQIPGCVYHSVALHELIHALGFVHEQTRPDRNQYVRIQTQNIVSGMEHNFDVFSRTDADTLGLSYDYGSIMHYRSDAFSSNGRPTIVPTTSDGKNWESKMGRGEKMSNLDIQKLKKYYSCS